jgi:ABC-type Fe3+ transport system permease subunit
MFLDIIGRLYLSKENAYAEQLTHIAEQMAIRNRRSKRLWKTIGIVLAIIIAVKIVIIVLGMVSYSSITSTENVQTYEETMELETLYWSSHQFA